jgi:hypothetical protein
MFVTQIKNIKEKRLLIRDKMYKQEFRGASPSYLQELVR